METTMICYGNLCKTTMDVKTSIQTHYGNPSTHNLPYENLLIFETFSTCEAKK